MPLTTYTTPAQVRATLGVSTTELPDVVLALPMYDTFADNALESVHEDAQVAFDSLSLVGTPTKDQSKFLAAAKLYVAYYVAKQLLASLPLFSVKQLSDGKADFSRQNDTFADVRDGVESMLGGLRSRLLTSLVVVDPGAAVTVDAVAIFTVATGLGTNPITG